MNTTPYQATLDKFESKIKFINEGVFKLYLDPRKMQNADRFHKYVDHACARVFQMFKDCFLLGYHSSQKVKGKGNLTIGHLRDFKEVVNEHIKQIDREHTNYNELAIKVICGDAYSIGFKVNSEPIDKKQMKSLSENLVRAISALFYTYKTYEGSLSNINGSTGEAFKQRERDHPYYYYEVYRQNYEVYRQNDDDPPMSEFCFWTINSFIISLLVGLIIWIIV